MPRIINTSLPGLTLRFADVTDVELIFSLIQELAEYEKMIDEVVADPALLKQSLFTGPQTTETIIAEYNNVAVGFALFFHNFSTFLGRRGIYLEDLYVKPEYRGKGIGKALLTCLAKLAVERHCGRLEWSVLDWNEPAIGFYKKLGAKPMDEWSVFRLTGGALDDLAKNS